MPRVAHGARPRLYGIGRASTAIGFVTGTTQPEAVPLTDDWEQIHWIEKALSYLYIAAGVMFILGSIFFMPGMEACYRSGVYLYFFGGFIYLKTSLFDLEEAYLAKGHEFEMYMN
mmetsp:Transcript_16522/g.51715  ORF Transcript_16522/g.51715 Transcript_16522/m.51715 type:complete len:115 (+) Transcript_16522:132-476(+)